MTLLLPYAVYWSILVSNGFFHSPLRWKERARFDEPYEDDLEVVICNTVDGDTDEIYWIMNDDIPVITYCHVAPNVDHSMDCTEPVDAILDALKRYERHGEDGLYMETWIELNPDYSNLLKRRDPLPIKAEHHRCKYTMHCRVSDDLRDCPTLAERLAKYEEDTKCDN